MDHTLKTLLTEWGLPQTTISKLEDNGFLTMEHLRGCTVEDVQHLLNLGDKIMFRNRLQAFKAEDAIILEIIQPHDSDLNYEKNESSPEKTSVSEGLNYNSPIAKRTPVRSSPRKKHSIGESTSAIPSVCRSLFSSPSSNNAMELDSFLNSNVQGISILQDYNVNGVLSESSRKQLAHLLVTNEINSNRDTLKISTDRFAYLARSVVKTFPGEEEFTYFYPFKVEGKKRTCAGGKLYNFYNNQRKLFRELNLISKKAKPSTSVLTDAVKSSLEWLERTAEPYDLAFNHWTSTFNARKEILKNLDIVQYYDRFLCLKNNFGYHLLLEDFKELYPGKESRLFDLWPEFRNKLIAQTHSKSVSDSTFRALLADLELINLPKDDGFLTVKAFQLLNLFIPQKVIHGKKKVFKPSSKGELLSYTFMIAPTFPDLKLRLEEKIQRFAPYELPVQPFPAIVNEGNERVTSYVCVNGNFYRVASPIVAIDTTFKICHALNAEYPYESKLNYVYMQRYIYEISIEDCNRFETVNKFHRILFPIKQNKN